MEAFKRVVENMMNRYGGEATVTVFSDTGTYDPDTSEYTATSRTFKVKSLIFDLTLQSNGMQSMPNSLILAGDKQVFLQPITNGVPLPALKANRDKIKIGTEEWNIVTLKEVNPSNTNRVLIEAYVRKS